MEVGGRAGMITTTRMTIGGDDRDVVGMMTMMNDGNDER